MNSSSCSTSSHVVVENQGVVQVETSQPFNLFEVAIQKIRVLTDTEKYELLTTSPEDKVPDEGSNLDVRYFPYKKGTQHRKVSFQRRWLREHNWLCYGAGGAYKGSWCLPSMLFLTGSEKVSLKIFVNAPFVNYNKSKEILTKHSRNMYHLRAVERSYSFKANYSNPQSRIDSRLADIDERNFKFNSEVLPILIEAVLTCARQKIPLQGHQQPSKFQ